MPTLQGELMAILHSAVCGPPARPQAADERKFDGRRGSRTIEDPARESP